jgi:hypothetical protein
MLALPPEFVPLLAWVSLLHVVVTIWELQTRWTIRRYDQNASKKPRSSRLFAPWPQSQNAKTRVA